MKNKVLSIVLSIIMLAIGVSVFAGVSYIEHNYQRKVVVTSVSGKEIECEDRQGHQWSFYTTEDNELTQGQHIKLSMNDNNTSIINDDIINDYKIIR